MEPTKNSDLSNNYVYGSTAHKEKKNKKGTRHEGVTDLQSKTNTLAVETVNTAEKENSTSERPKLQRRNSILKKKEASEINPIPDSELKQARNRTVSFSRFLPSFITGSNRKSKSETVVLTSSKKTSENLKKKGGTRSESIVLSSKKEKRTFPSESLVLPTQEEREKSEISLSRNHVNSQKSEQSGTVQKYEQLIKTVKSIHIEKQNINETYRNTTFSETASLAKTYFNGWVSALARSPKIHKKVIELSKEFKKENGKIIGEELFQVVANELLASLVGKRNEESQEQELISFMREMKQKLQEYFEHETPEKCEVVVITFLLFKLVQAKMVDELIRLPEFETNFMLPSQILNCLSEYYANLKELPSELRAVFN